MIESIEIRPLTAADAVTCDAIIASLPHFFGDPTGIRDCAEAVRTQRGYVATLGSAVAAFLTIEQHDPSSAEITWMAVHAEHRRRGLGRRLIGHVVAELPREGVHMLCVLTLGPSVPDPGEDTYDGTRAFYLSTGFVPLRELSLSTWNDQFALMLARAI